MSGEHDALLETLREIAWEPHRECGYKHGCECVGHARLRRLAWKAVQLAEGSADGEQTPAEPEAGADSRP